MSDWQQYPDTVEKHTVVGDLRVWRDFYSPQLDNNRDVLVWLPPGYEDGEQRYPVLYMHDGDNLFDAHASYAGEWQVDETMTILAQEGYAAIVVGLPNMGEERPLEYDPYPGMDGKPHRGAAYTRFLVDTVKPLIDSAFRTLPDVAHTGIAGSSMGGLISLYGFLMYPQTFGFCGAFSTAYWFGDSALVGTIRERANGHGRIYLDVGTGEGDTLDRWIAATGIEIADTDAEYVRGVRELRDVLLENGYTTGQNLKYVEEDNAPHHESAWARRLPDALRFLLPK